MLVIKLYNISGGDNDGQEAVIGPYQDEDTAGEDYAVLDLVGDFDLTLIELTPPAERDNPSWT